MPYGVHVIIYTQRCNIRSVKADLIIRLTPADLSFRHSLAGSRNVTHSKLLHKLLNRSDEILKCNSNLVSKLFLYLQEMWDSGYVVSAYCFIKGDS